MSDDRLTITRGREITFNPIPYETVKVWATVTHQVDEGETEDETAAYLDELLTTLLAEEIDAVAAVTTNPKSIVSDYRDSA